MQIRNKLMADPFWERYLNEVVIPEPSSVAVHLGIFVEPYLQFILSGKKVVESRFSVRRRPPFGAAKQGDVLLLKEAGGPVVGISRIGIVSEYNLDPKSFAELRLEFAAALCAHDPEFWEERMDAAFATLMRLENVRPVSPIAVKKSDRRGWVVLRGRSRQLLLWEDYE